MNWKRIWTGGAVAGLAICLIDLFQAYIQGYCLLGQRPELLGNFRFYLLFGLVHGTVLSGLYALARPRLGPGPKTALVMSSVLFVLMSAVYFDPAAWAGSNKKDLILKGMGLLFSWIKYAVAAYLAGWQYIEKAPS